LLLWLAGLLFMEWKYGCVRSDEYHIALMLAVVPSVAICMEALPAAGMRAMFWGRAACLVSVAAACLLVQSQFHGLALVRCALQAGNNLAANLGIVVQPARYLREKNDALQAEQKKYQLPMTRAAAGRATADIFGQNQALAIFNGLDYQPRPVFQSYAAYNRAMMELNERFYISNDAPQYVVFSLQPIGGRFPPLEDSFLLRDLLANYAFVFKEGDYLLLQRKRTVMPKLSLIKDGAVSAGEKIDVPNPGNARLWLEIDLQPTLFGRLRQFLYKPPETRLLVWDQSGAAPAAKFSAPAVMLSAGFLASPLLLDNSDVMNFYAGTNTRPANTFSVEFAPGLVNAWQPMIHFRLYRAED
jgi:hypothetical protein